MQNDDYNADQSIDLNLTQSELISMQIALEKCLFHSVLPVEYKGGKLVMLDGTEPRFPATSHLGVLIALFNRVNMASLGNKNWNNRDIFPARKS